MTVSNFNASWDGKELVFAMIGKKTYTFFFRLYGLLGETLYAVMDDKNNYKVIEYDAIMDKDIIVLQKGH